MEKNDTANYSKKLRRAKTLVSCMSSHVDCRVSCIKIICSQRSRKLAPESDETEDNESDDS